VPWFYQEDIAVIFSKADKNNSGKLDLKDFKDVVGDIIERYPQVEIYLKKNQMKDMASLLRKSQESDITVDIEYFKEALSKVDSQMKNLPATAQVQVQHILLLNNNLKFFLFKRVILLVLCDTFHL